MAYKAFQTLLSSIAGETHLKYLEKKNFNQQVYSNIKPSRTSNWMYLHFQPYFSWARQGVCWKQNEEDFFSQEENENPNWGQNQIIITVLKLRNPSVSVQALFFVDSLQKTTDDNLCDR